MLEGHLETRPKQLFSLLLDNLVKKDSSRERARDKVNTRLIESKLTTY